MKINHDRGVVELPMQEAVLHDVCNIIALFRLKRRIIKLVPNANTFQHELLVINDHMVRTETVKFSFMAQVHKDRLLM